MFTKRVTTPDGTTLVQQFATTDIGDQFGKLAHASWTLDLANSLTSSPGTIGYLWSGPGSSGEVGAVQVPGPAPVKRFVSSATGAYVYVTLSNPSQQVPFLEALGYREDSGRSSSATGSPPGTHSSRCSSHRRP